MEIAERRPRMNFGSVTRNRTGGAEAMLEARGLTKRYGGLLALDKVSFQLKRGEIVGYLGPNAS